MSFSDGQLSQRPPKIALLVRTRLPARLQDLVGVERAVFVQETPRLPESLLRAEEKVVRRRGDALCAAGERTAVRVPWPGATGTALAVPVSLVHRDSHERSSSLKVFWRSSCGKCPAASMSVHV